MRGKEENSPSIPRRSLGILGAVFAGASAVLCRRRASPKNPSLLRRYLEDRQDRSSVWRVFTGGLPSREAMGTTAAFHRRTSGSRRLGAVGKISRSCWKMHVPLGAILAAAADGGGTGVLSSSGPQGAREGGWRIRGVARSFLAIVVGTSGSWGLSRHRRGARKPAQGDNPVVHRVGRARARETARYAKCGNR